MKNIIAFIFVGLILVSIILFFMGNYNAAFGVGFVVMLAALAIGNFFQFETREFLHREYDHKRFVDRFNRKR
ncbi:hypothetical protein LC040_17755 [Bacillus tianshenii]|nr:hypothetical protein LC040_17755 [Bacillus tianshenii]